MRRAGFSAPCRRRVRLFSLAAVVAIGLAPDARADTGNLSADGKLVVFKSTAANLPGANGASQVYLRDLVSGETRLVSMDPSGNPGDSTSSAPVISANGHRVAFHSEASNLVLGDTNGAFDVFVHHLGNGRTRRVSVSSDGTQAGGHSPAISDDGRRVAFQSGFANLVEDDTNGEVDVFVHNLRTGRTERVSVRSNGTEGDIGSHHPSISGDGRRVTFGSEATTLVKGDSNGRSDVFVHNIGNGRTERVSVSSSGEEAKGTSATSSISADGRRVAFTSGAFNLIAVDNNVAFDIFVHNLRNGKTKRVSVRSNGAQGDDDSLKPSISADGRTVAFESEATNLVGGDGNGHRDVFVHDMRSGETVRASVSSNGAEANRPGLDLDPSISADGRRVGFSSMATNLVEGDTNGDSDFFRGFDVFWHNLRSHRTRRASVNSDEAELDGPSCMRSCTTPD